jgi:hypothetical protein
VKGAGVLSWLVGPRRQVVCTWAGDLKVGKEQPDTKKIKENVSTKKVNTHSITR